VERPRDPKAFEFICLSLPAFHFPPHSSPPLSVNGPPSARAWMPALPHGNGPRGFSTGVPTPPPGTRPQAVASPPSGSNEAPPKAWKLELLYDSDCPLCMKVSLRGRGLPASSSSFSRSLRAIIRRRAEPVHDLPSCLSGNMIHLSTYLSLTVCVCGGVAALQEVEFLRKRDVEGSIRFTDLNEPGYDPAEHGGVGFEEGMKVIHAVLPGGNTIKGACVPVG
jgi:hypothetical protein